VQTAILLQRNQGILHMRRHGIQAGLIYHYGCGMNFKNAKKLYIINNYSFRFLGADPLATKTSVYFVVFRPGPARQGSEPVRRCPMYV
jgi:hypothetical protein